MDIIENKIICPNIEFGFDRCKKVHMIGGNIKPYDDRINGIMYKHSRRVMITLGIWDN